MFTVCGNYYVIVIGNSNEVIVITSYVHLLCIAYMLMLTFP